MIAIDLHRKRIVFHPSLSPRERYSKLMELFKNNRMLICQVQYPPFPMEDYLYHYQSNPMPINIEKNWSAT